mmetsp:Transcript_15534/g.29959  ORF Transcript_15534/g.29959 Transcript_15534/m.29959 type:complete len:279 (-) Transcript_15534:328-1164(-)
MVQVEDWPVEDDVVLCDALEEGATLEAVAAGLFVTFSHPWSVLEIENRWRAMLFSPTIAEACSLRMANHSQASGKEIGPEISSGLPVHQICQARLKMQTTNPNPQASTIQAEGAASEPERPCLDWMQQSPPNFSDAEQMVVQAEGRGTQPGSKRPATCRARTAGLMEMSELERASAAATQRELERVGALAALRGARTCFLIHKPNTLIGRSTDEKKVDVDLAEEGGATKVSREQAHIKLRHGAFKLVNVGRRAILLNNTLVETGHARPRPVLPPFVLH